MAAPTRRSETAPDGVNLSDARFDCVTQVIEPVDARSDPLRSSAERVLSDEACPLCHATAKIAFVKHGHAVCDCTLCGHRFASLHPDPQQHVAAVYSDDYFTGGAAGYQNYLAEAKLLTASGRRYARRLSRYAKPGRMLDVGAAAGFLLKGFVDAGWQGVGIEPNDSVASHARTALGLDVRTGMFEEFEADQPLDLVSIIQVMAHFVDPSAAVRKADSLLAERGLCLVETWNVRSWTARLFGRSWHEYSPPSVLHWFSPDRLRDLFREHGFVEVARGRPQKWLDGQHAKSLLRHALPKSLPGRLIGGMAGIVPDRLPIPYPSEDLFWSLFRKEPGR